ncbi:hypothetical protein KIPB_004101 [Kipferlia bialata]|uniref:Uncharacterized protein n=1 Tax=Kipferlia bialata TaxID=797122 RepID=A0A9K3CWH3_9EUKA|nr:hypothetical protein KIPB_004101 [Kipferlia bialata]|eukprot:g4101.t1
MLEERVDWVTFLNAAPFLLRNAIKGMVYMGVVIATFGVIHMYRGKYQGRFYESLVSERWTATLTLMAAVFSLIATVPYPEEYQPC